MTSPERAHQAQATQWLRLRDLRRTRAEAQAREARQAQADALAATQAAQALVTQHQRARQALLHEIADARWLPRWAEQAHARREQIEDQLERAEYALIDDEEALHRCDRELDQAAEQLRRACAGSDVAQQVLASARRQLLTATERHAEREDPPLRSSLAMTPGARP